jgi:hypothetical protein
MILIGYPGGNLARVGLWWDGYGIKEKGLAI